MSLQHERERCARDRHTAERLNEIARHINVARDLADVGADATRDQHAAVRTLLIEISNKLTDAADALNRETKQEGAAHAA